MKLSDKTTLLLKNFSSINQSILFKTGNRLRSMSVMKNILAEATIEEDIPKDFGIYDLNQFLNGLSLQRNPLLDFTNKEYVLIKQGDDKEKAEKFYICESGKFDVEINGKKVGEVSIN